MSSRNYWKFLFALMLLVSTVANADYMFAVPNEVVEVTINPDSSLDVEYWTTFENSVAGYDIDVIDIGFNSGDFNPDEMMAEVDGVAVSYIAHSTYIDNGVEVHPAYPIPAGGTATLHFKGRNYRRVYEDSEDERFASVIFGTNWYGSQYCYGEKNLTVRMVFPPGTDPKIIKYHENEGGAPTNSYVRDDGRVVYEYNLPHTLPSERYTFGVSFPRNLVSDVRKPPGILETLIGLVIIFITFIVETFAAFSACLVPAIIFFVIGLFSRIGKRKRRMKYLPPLAKAEGVGIKRGLTAPEAALLMEKPLDKIMTLIMFGLIKKSVVRITSEKPLKLEKLPDAQMGGVRKYEKIFLTAIKDDGELKESTLSDMIKGMIDGLEDKMKGFSYKETVAYYRSILTTAWKLVEEANTPEMKMQEFTNSMEWTMLDDKFDERSSRTFSSVSYFPVPYWWGFAHPTYYSQTTPSLSSGISTPNLGGGISVPELPGADFASGIVGSFESISSGVVSKIQNFTGGITSVTNPPPVRTSSGGGGGGGSGCACACACAGCACACAGGGR